MPHPFQPGIPTSNEIDNGAQLHAADLLARARRLDRNALALLHKELYPQIYRYVGFRLADERACAEITAQVFVEFLAALRKRRAPRTDLHGWLLREAGRLVDAALHKAGDAQNPAAPALFLPEAESARLRDRFYTALRSLPLEQQHILALRFSQPLPLVEIARILGKPEEKLRQQQQRALAGLQAYLEGAA